MTSEQMDKIIDRIATDDAYRDRFLADPAAAAAEHGATLSAEETATIRDMTGDELRAFASEYRSSTDPSKRRAAC
jgi:putative modified peptide